MNNRGRLILGIRLKKHLHAIAPDGMDAGIGFGIFTTDRELRVKLEPLSLSHSASPSVKYWSKTHGDLSERGRQPSDGALFPRVEGKSASFPPAAQYLCPPLDRPGSNLPPLLQTQDRPAPNRGVVARSRSSKTHPTEFPAVVCIVSRNRPPVIIPRHPPSFR